MPLFIMREVARVPITIRTFKMNTSGEPIINSKHLIITDNNLMGEVKSGDCLYIKRYKTTLVVGVEDTPSSVAKKLGISVEEMYKINKTNYIYPFMVVVND